MGFLDKFKNAIGTATDVINKSLDSASDAINNSFQNTPSVKNLLSDPIEKQYYDITYGLMKTIGEANYDAIKKYIEYQLGSPCDEIKLQNSLECFWGSPLYHIAGKNTFRLEKQDKLDEINKTLEDLELYRCTREEAYNICYKKEKEEIATEFVNVLDVIEKYGFKHIAEGMDRIRNSHYKSIGFNACYHIMHMVVKEKFTENNATTEIILTRSLDLATYSATDRAFRIASIVLRALHFDKFGNSEDGYETITHNNCLKFVSKNEGFVTKANELTAENPFDNIDYKSNFADSILDVNIMSGLRDKGRTESWMPFYSIEPFYTDKVCYLFWKKVAEHYNNDTIDTNEIYDMIWDYTNPEE